MNAPLLLLIGGVMPALATQVFSEEKVRNSILAQTPEYIVLDIGTLGGAVSHARDINERGEVAGVAQDGDSGNYHAFLYADGFMQDLGTLTAEHSEALGINDRGQVVGTIWNDDFSIYHAFLYSSGAMEDLGTLSGKYSAAFDINNDGQVVGWSRINDGLGSNRAFLYENGVMRNLGKLQGGRNSEAYGINSSGDVVGASTTFGFGRNRAFLYSNGIMQNLGTLQYDSQAYGISDVGHVVGESLVSSFGDTRAFLYAEGVMQNLGTLGGSSSWAYGVNNLGQVVGESKTSAGRSAAFRYRDDAMKDLNDLIDPAAKWRLTRAISINSNGQIVGTGINPAGKEHGFLLQPVSLPIPDWWPGMEETPIQPTYGTLPAKEAGKDSLIVVTHGWNPDIAWLDEMTNAVTGYLRSRGLNNWQVHAHKWVEGARTSLPDTALSNGENEGARLGQFLSNKGWRHIHLVAHSAGAGLIQAASEAIKQNSVNRATVHLTFLDAYVGLIHGGKSKYGKGADWTDSYFSHDPNTVLTDKLLDNAYNVDATWLDPTRQPIPIVYSTPSGDVSQVCYQQITSHGWPHEFYISTIAPRMVPGSEGFGFPLSKEGGNWSFATNAYKIGRNALKVLGNEEPPCGSSPSESLLFAGKPIDFSALPSGALAMNSPANITVRNTGFILKTASPVWMTAAVPVTGSVNLVSFEARFLSSNAEGLLSVYFGTNVLGSIDERVAVTKIRQYMLPVPERVGSGTRILGFRLDAFSPLQSSVLVTNVAFGFVGIREPFSLSFTGRYVGKAPVLQLTGPSGYNYRVEDSTNLRNWETVAVLVNTNGFVRFIDSTSTNTAYRFYRAVVP